MQLKPPNFRSRARHERKRHRRVSVTAEEAEELILCSPACGVAGFIRWCRNWVTIQDKKTKAEVPFDLFVGQRKIVPLLILGLWIIGLKGRQVGWTWLMAAWVLWKMSFSPTAFLAIVVSQELDYANDFIERVKWIHKRLPEFMRLEITRENDSRLEFRARGHDACLRSIAGTKKTARSLTADLLIYDEAPQIDYLKESLRASIPALEVSGGQIIVLGTSDGPQGMFYKLWGENYGLAGELVGPNGKGPGNFVPVFVHWSERRGRDLEWYKDQERILAQISPVAIKYEHPNTPQEAWEYAAGKVYTLFTPERSVGRIENLPQGVDRYRAIDWGDSVSAQVVLWLAHIPGPPGLLVHPDCTNTIREFLGYRWDEAHPQKPIETDDHTCDALRYAVTVFNLTGLVYVYRELYRKDSVDKGWNLMREIEEIHELSGWVLAPPEYQVRWWRGREGEAYAGPVADASRRKDIALLRNNDIPCSESTRFRERHKISRKNEKLAGIRMLAMLIDGEVDIRKNVRITRDAVMVADYLADLDLAMRHTIPLERRAAHRMAREVMARLRAKRSGLR